MVATMRERSRQDCSAVSRRALLGFMAAALMVMGLLLRFGVRCPDVSSNAAELGRHVQFSVFAIGKPGPTVRQQAEGAHCRHDLTHTRFVALFGSGSFIAPTAQQVADTCTATPSSVLRAIQWIAPRAPPPATILHCVQLS